MKLQIRLLAIMAAAVLSTMTFASAASADENDNGCKDPGPQIKQTNVVGASVSSSGTKSTYEFSSQDTHGDEGVPGLIKYCVFPGSQPTSVTVDETPGTGAQGWDLSFFNDPPAFNSFSFKRDTGNESNIPLDGSTRTMGTAVWSGGAPAASAQAITLHINDASVCAELYETPEAGLEEGTCWVLPGNPEEVEIAADLTATKDATPFFKRTYAWEIEKEVDKTRVEIAAGGTATFEYTVTVKHDEGTDSDWAVSGAITVNNPNEGEVTGVDVEDAIDDSGATCTVEGGTNASIPANSSTEFEYECTYSGPPENGEETNTATVSWPEQTVDGKLLDEGSAEAEAAVDWDGTEPEVIDGSVEVEDTLGGSLGTVSASDPSPEEFTYTKEFEGDPAGTCTTHDNEATFRTDDTGTEGSANREVEVCVGSDLEVSKTANPSFTRTFPWEVSKDVDQTRIDIAEGGTATFHYTIDFTKGAGEDGEWLVKGAITVTNPNDWEAITVDVEDEIDDPSASCVVAEGNDAEIPAGESVEFEYECEYGAAPESDEETNTATVTWDAEEASTPSGSAEGQAGIDWGTTIPTEFDNCVEATDTVDGVPSNLDKELCESETYETEREFSGDPAGTCTEHTNTAAFIAKDTESTGESGKTVEVCVGADLEVGKTAKPSFTRKFPWSVSKTVDKTKVTQSGGTVTFKYTIKFVKGAGVDSGWLAKGTITVTNPNDWETIEADVSDAIDDSNAKCTVSEGEDAEIPAGGSKEFEYECTYSAAPKSGTETNTATATWDAVEAATPSGSAKGTAAVNWGTTSPTEVDDCVEATDTVDGVPTQLSEKLCESKTYETELTFPVETGCVAHNNTATFKTDDTGTEGSASRKVEVCAGPLQTGALTMGFWHNKNGQKIITDGKSTGKTCNSGTWLRQFNPFKDLSESASCKDVAAYFLKVFEAANASGASMNAMLKAQMLATALNVYFSDPALGGNKLEAPKPLGSQKIDLTKWSGGFGGAKSMTVLQMLEYAAGQSNSGGSVWYGQVKTTQGFAKDAFDAINNQQAMGA